MAAFQENKIQEVYEEKYPHIFKDINAAKDDRGLLHFIAGNVIDLKILEGALPDEAIAQGGPGAAIAPGEAIARGEANAQGEETLIRMGGEPDSPGPSQPTSSMNLRQSLEIEEIKRVPGPSARKES
jgi:hypothetical protein